MTDRDTLAPQKALDSMAVAPPPDPAAERNACHPRQTAGQDPAIADRLARHPHNADAKLDEALDETMDASDPPALTQPRRADPPADPSDADRVG